MKKGVFISFEGTDGCGKSTQIRFLAEALTAAGYDVLCTREPGGCPVSERLREIMLSSESGEILPLTELLICEAARAQHVGQVIIPALEQGKIVLCDRFTHSTTAYQGAARGMGNLVEELNAVARQGCVPDITIMLLIDPESSFKRKGGVDGGDRIELAGSDFHSAVYKSYCEQSAADKRVFAIHVQNNTKQQTAAMISDYVMSHIDGGKI